MPRSGAFILFSLFQFFGSCRMSQLPESFRTRTKQYAASVVRFYVALPKTQEEVIVLTTSVAAHIRKASRARSDAELVSKLARSERQTNSYSGSKFFVANAPSLRPSPSP